LALYGAFRISTDRVKRVQLSVLCCLAVILLLPIMASVKRLWFFYLHLGMIFGILAFVKSLEPMYWNWLPRFVKFLQVSAILAVSLWILVFVVPQQVRELSSLSSRTQTEEYRVRKAQFDFYRGFIESYHAKNPSRKISVAIDPVLFQSDDSGIATIERFYGYFDGWKEKKDIVLLTDQSNPKYSSVNPGSVEYEKWMHSRTEYEQHVDSMLAYPQYVELPVRIGDMNIYQLSTN
jgi:hypothetical protein